MPNKALISELTWRSLEMQKQAFPDMPHFVAPHEIKMMLRPSTRREQLNIYVVSFAVIADNENDFRDFMAMVVKRKAFVFAKNTHSKIGHPNLIESAVESWRQARRDGAAKAGGEANAKKAESEFWEGFAKIADRWHLPAQGANASPALLAEANTSRNTVKSYLGYNREVWQALSQAKRDRILKGKFNPLKEVLDATRR